MIRNCLITFQRRLRFRHFWRRPRSFSKHWWSFLLVHRKSQFFWGNNWILVAWKTLKYGTLWQYTTCLCNLNKPYLTLPYPTVTTPSLAIPWATFTSAPISDHLIRLAPSCAFSRNISLIMFYRINAGFLLTFSAAKLQLLQSHVLRSTIFARKIR